DHERALAAVRQGGAGRAGALRGGVGRRLGGGRGVRRRGAGRGARVVRAGRGWRGRREQGQEDRPARHRPLIPWCRRERSSIEESGRVTRWSRREVLAALAAAGAVPAWSSLLGFGGGSGRRAAAAAER